MPPTGLWSENQDPINPLPATLRLFPGNQGTTSPHLGATASRKRKAGQCSENVVPGRFCAPNPRARALLPLGTRRSPVSKPASPQLGWQCPQLAREWRPPLLYSLPLALHYFAALPMCSYPSHLLQEALLDYLQQPFLLFLQAQTPPPSLHPCLPSPLPSFLVSSPHSLPASLLQEPPGARPTLFELTIGTHTCVWLQQACASVWVRLPAENGCSRRE